MPLNLISASSRWSSGTLSGWLVRAACRTECQYANLDALRDCANLVICFFYFWLRSAPVNAENLCLNLSQYAVIGQRMWWEHKPYRSISSASIESMVDVNQRCCCLGFLWGIYACFSYAKKQTSSCLIGRTLEEDVEPSIWNLWVWEACWWEYYIFLHLWCTRNNNTSAKRGNFWLYFTGLGDAWLIARLYEICFET